MCLKEIVLLGPHAIFKGNMRYLDSSGLNDPQSRGTFGDSH